MIPIKTDLMHEFLESVCGPTPRSGLFECVIERLNEFDFWTQNLSEPPANVRTLHDSIGHYTDHAEDEIIGFIESRKCNVAVLDDIYWSPGGLGPEYEKPFEIIYNRTGRYKVLRSEDVVSDINGKSVATFINAIQGDRYIIAFFDQARFPMEALREGDMDDVVKQSSSVAVLAFVGEKCGQT